jgi:Leucine-rich repeat (LRR) protein
MKKLLLILFCLPNIGFGQQKTYIPDNNFELCLDSLGLDDGNPYNDSVYTSAIDTLTYLNLHYQYIYNLIGIEDFTDLEYLDVGFNNLDSIDISNNDKLKYLDLSDNNLYYLSSINLGYNISLLHLDIRGNGIQYIINFDYLPNLEALHIGNNNIDSIDVSNNIYLRELNGRHTSISHLNLYNNDSLKILEFWNSNITGVVNLNNKTILRKVKLSFNNIYKILVKNTPNLTSLEFSNNQLTSIYVQESPKLIELICRDNPISLLTLVNNPNFKSLTAYGTNLSVLNLKNGNNGKITRLEISLNPNLYCVQLDDPTYADSIQYIIKDPQTYFSSNCNYVNSIEDITKQKYLVKVIDVLGRKTKERRNTPLFYIFDDGTVEKKIIIE